MRQIRIKVMPAMGAAEGRWRICSFDVFLTRHSPGLRMHVSLANQFPPFHVLNEELLSGGADQGMSGGCFWEPFELTIEEYKAIAEEMLTDPERTLNYDPELESRRTLSKWCGAVITKYNHRKKDS